MVTTHMHFKPVGSVTAGPTLRDRYPDAPCRTIKTPAVPMKPGQNMCVPPPEVIAMAHSQAGVQCPVDPALLKPESMLRGPSSPNGLPGSFSAQNQFGYGHAPYPSSNPGLRLGTPTLLGPPVRRGGLQGTSDSIPTLYNVPPGLQIPHLPSAMGMPTDTPFLIPGKTSVHSTPMRQVEAVPLKNPSPKTIMTSGLHNYLIGGKVKGGPDQARSRSVSPHCLPPAAAKDLYPVTPDFQAQSSRSAPVKSKEDSYSDSESDYVDGASFGCVVSTMKKGVRRGLQQVRQALPKKSEGIFLPTWQQKEAELRRLSTPLQRAVRTDRGVRAYPPCVPAGQANVPTVPNLDNLEDVLMAELPYPPPGMTEEEFDHYENWLATLPPHQGYYWRLHAVREQRADIIAQCIKRSVQSRRTRQQEKDQKNATLHSERSEVVTPGTCGVSGVATPALIPDSLSGMCNLPGEKQRRVHPLICPAIHQWPATIPAEEPCKNELERQFAEISFRKWAVGEKLRYLDGAMPWLRSRGLRFSREVQWGRRQAQMFHDAWSGRLVQWMFMDEIPDKPKGMLEYLCDSDILMQWQKTQMDECSQRAQHAEEAAPKIGAMLQEWLKARVLFVQEYRRLEQLEHRCYKRLMAGETRAFDVNTPGSPDYDLAGWKGSTSFQEPAFDPKSIRLTTIGAEILYLESRHKEGLMQLQRARNPDEADLLRFRLNGIFGQLWALREFESVRWQVDPALIPFPRSCAAYTLAPDGQAMFGRPTCNFTLNVGRRRRRLIEEKMRREHALERERWISDRQLENEERAQNGLPELPSEPEEPGLIQSIITSVRDFFFYRGQ